MTATIERTTRQQRRDAGDMARKGRPNKKHAELQSYLQRFAARLQTLRQAKFETQAEFLAALNALTAAELAALGVEIVHPAKTTLELSRTTVAGWEQGYRCPAPALFPALAHVLGVKARELLPDE